MILFAIILSIISVAALAFSPIGQMMVKGREVVPLSVALVSLFFSGYVWGVQKGKKDGRDEGERAGRAEGAASGSAAERARFQTLLQNAQCERRLPANRPAARGKIIFRAQVRPDGTCHYQVRDPRPLPDEHFDPALNKCIIEAIMNLPAKQTCP